MPKQYAVRVVEDTHEHWKSLHLVNKLSTVTKGGDTVVRPVVEGSQVPVTTEHPAKVISEQQANSTGATTAPGTKPTRTVGEADEQKTA